MFMLANRLDDQMEEYRYERDVLPDKYLPQITSPSFEFAAAIKNTLTA
jgi:hypothetical protein